MSQSLEKQKCQHIKSDSSQCQSYPMKDELYCYLHHPAIPEEEKKAVQAKGGSVGTLTIVEALPEIQITEPEDVVKLLSTTINEVRAGKIDLRAANSLGYLSGQLLKAFEVSDLKKRIEFLESFLKSK